MQVPNARTIILFAALALSCAGRRFEIATMPPDVRAGWDRCEALIDRWCIDHANGHRADERACMFEESGRYASQPDEASRNAYLRAHGCNL